MFTHAAAEKDSSSDLTPEVSPSMPWRVAEVKPLGNFRLFVRFVDGLTGTVDMGAFIKSKEAGVFSALSDPLLFDQVFLLHGAVTWPGELDIAPDAMHRQIREKGEWKL